jgi:hypothetical protein
VGKSQVARSNSLTRTSIRPFDEKPWLKMTFPRYDYLNPTGSQLIPF